MSSTGLITSALPSFHLSISPSTHSLSFFSIQSFHSFSLKTLHPCCPVTICCSPLYIVLFLSDLFTCLTTSFQKTFVCFSLVALLPNQAGTETYRLLYYLTHTVKMISSSHVPGCPRHVGEINFIFYLLKLLLTRHWLYNPAVVFTEMGFREVDE